jgi:DnaJ-class molecular chaperone
MATRKIVDPDSGESYELEDCPDCHGLGGFDASHDCEVYDDWRKCDTCDGAGEVAAGFDKPDVFDPKRDAWTPND